MAFRQKALNPLDGALGHAWRTCQFPPARTNNNIRSFVRCRSRPLKLIAENMAVDRGDRRVFSRLSFALEGGVALVVTGPNGVGKSSLLRTLAGLVPLAEGSLSLEGGQQETTVAEHSHYFGHQSAIKPALSVEENLLFWQAFTAPVAGFGYTSEAINPSVALDLMGIGHTANLPAAYLSAGQTRRLALARLFVSPRPIWLMDEPTSALDASAEKQLFTLMNDHLAKGGMIITATHTPLEIEPLTKLRLEPLPAEELASMAMDELPGDLT